MASLLAVDDGDRAYERRVDDELAGGIDVDDDRFWSFADAYQGKPGVEVRALLLGLTLGALAWALIWLIALAVYAALS